MAKVRLPDLALDLGTSRTRLIGRSGEPVCDMPSAVAVRGREILAHGEAAARMEGRTPDGVEVCLPVRGGVVTDFRAAEHLIAAALQGAGRRGWLKPRVLLALGAEATEVERRAALESVRAAGARDVAVVSRTVAAALGSGLPVREPVGHCIADLGAGGSRAAVIALGAPVVHRAVTTGGDALTDAIRTWLRDDRDLLVELRTAENLKLHLVDLSNSVIKQTRIRGREPGGDRPKELDVTTTELNAALERPVQRIREAIRDVLRRTSPELSADLLDRGLLLAGGTSSLPGLDALIREDTGLAVLHVDHPEHAVVRGCQQLLDDVDRYKAIVMGDR